MVENFGWILDAIEADKIPLVMKSGTKRERNLMTPKLNRTAAISELAHRKCKSRGILE